MIIFNQKEDDDDDNNDEDVRQRLKAKNAPFSFFDIELV